MSVQQSLATGLIGLVIAGAGAVGVYNYTTSGCFLGSCSSKATASTSKTAQVGLSVAASESVESGDSCCPLGDGASKLKSVALDDAGESSDESQTCDHAASELTLVAGEIGAEEACGGDACETEKTPESTTIEAALPSDD